MFCSVTIAIGETVLLSDNSYRGDILDKLAHPIKYITMVSEQTNRITVVAYIIKITTSAFFVRPLATRSLLDQFFSWTHYCQMSPGDWASPMD